MKKAKTAIIAVLFFGMIAIAQEAGKLGDHSDGSLGRPVHKINLLAADESTVGVDDEVVLPFSTKATCGECHTYEKVSGGWHFNAMDPNVPAGRSGQPWIYYDGASGIQIPLAYRDWPRCFKPGDVGLTTWQFVKQFGRQMPGGGAGELESDIPEEVIRQFVSGTFEINCLACHSGSFKHDQSENATQVGNENYMWAATATSGLGSVTGSAKEMPETYDPMMPGFLDNPKLKPPAVVYDKCVFDHKDRVNMDIVREVSNERCYFCHSNVDIADGEHTEKWESDEDVHIAAGMKCVDCHRNGLSHDIVRGYEGEVEFSKNPMAAASSCQGCHLGMGNDNKPDATRLGSPYPEHKGIPAIHFDKLSCTACHSGAWAGESVVMTKTSRGHGLGLKNVNLDPDALPHVYYPVYSDELSIDGKITPYKAVWPAYWADVAEDGNVSPVAIEVSKSIVTETIGKGRSDTWREFSEEDIASVLAAMAGVVEGDAGYVAGGKLYTVSDGTVTSVEHEAAAAVMWPIAHNVRSAGQSLGARSCGDCHSPEAAFLFGKVTAEGPVDVNEKVVKAMLAFQDVDEGYMRTFAGTFVFRPVLKVVVLASCFVIAGVILLYALGALRWAVKVFAGKE